MKHCQGQRDKGQGHKVTRRCSINISNIFSKRRSIVENVCLKGNRGPRGEWRGPIFDKKPFLRMRSENMPNTCQIATNSAPL